MQYNITTRQLDTKKAKSWQVIVSYKDKFGSWKQRTKSGFPTSKACKAYGDKIVAELKEKADLNIEYESITFQEFAKEFLASSEVRLEPSTMRVLRISITKFNLLNDLQLQEITKMEIQKIVDDLTKEGLRPSTIRQYVKYLKTMFRAAIDYELISKDPTIGIKTARNKTTPTQSSLTDKEVEELLESFRDSKHYNLIYLLSRTGLRIGEACGLTYQDIDLQKLEIRVNKQWKNIGNNKHDFGALKSKNSNRIVPISQKTADTLKQMFNITPKKTGRIFDYNTDHIISNLNKMLKAKGYNISVHTLRHTFITKLLSGIPPKMVAEIAGHSLDMTMKIYNHINQDTKDLAKKVINEIL